MKYQRLRPKTIDWWNNISKKLYNHLHKHFIVDQINNKLLAPANKQLRKGQHLHRQSPVINILLSIL